MLKCLGNKNVRQCVLASWPLEHIYLTIRHFSICIDLALDTFLHNSCFYSTYNEVQELLKTKKPQKTNKQAKTNQPPPKKKPQRNQQNKKTPQIKKKTPEVKQTKKPTHSAKQQPLKSRLHQWLNHSFPSTEFHSFHLNVSKHQNKGVLFLPG